MTGEEKVNTPVRTYAFHREGAFYLLDLPSGTVADNAECNPGTLRVEDMDTGEIVWVNPK